MAKKTNTSIGKYQYYRIRRKVGMKQNKRGEWVPEHKQFYGSSKKEAEDKFDAFMRSKSTAYAACFGEFVSWYTDNILKQDSSLKDSTKSRYINAYVNVFSGSKILGRTVESITGADLQDALNRSGRAASTKRQAVKLLRLFYKYLETQHIARDVTGALVLPAIEHKKQDQDIEIFTDEEIKLFINKTPEEHRLRFLVILAINTGCRIAELAALTYDDIKDNQLIVNKALSEIDPVKHTNAEGTEPDPEEKKEKARVEVSTTKTLTSVRSIPLSDSVIKAFEIHKRWHTAEMMKNGYRTDYIFTTSNGSLYYKSTLRTAFKRLCKRVGVRPRGFHTFRHTFGSRLAANNVPIQTVSKLMGHADISVTSKYYINISTDEKSAAIAALNY